MCWSKFEQEKFEAPEVEERQEEPTWTADKPPVEEVEPRQTDERETELVEA